MSDELVILIPVLGRPHRVRPVLESIAASTPQPYRALFIADPNDHEEIEAISTAGGELLVYGGGFASKINQGIRATTEPLIFVGADDLHFEPGWLQTAKRYFVDGVQVVGVNDLCSLRVKVGRHATHWLMTRAYAETPGIDGHAALSEAYEHSAVDDEFVAVAIKRKAIAFAKDSHVRHLHPDNGGAEWDATYQKGRRNIKRDVQLFRRRKRIYDL